MKGNIYMYAMLVLLMAVIVAILVQFMANIVPTNQGRQGNIIHISQFSFGFAPNYIELRKGEKISLFIKNEGGRHQFFLPGFDIYIEVDSGKSATIPLTANKTGEFLFYDPLPGHNESGEFGTLVIKP